MKDSYQREIKYLRLSVTDLCNLRCKYCMPKDGVDKKSHDQILTEEEIIRAVEVLATIGVTKVRVTGGEPLIKKNIISILDNIRRIDGIKTLAITTNGLLLDEKAQDIKNAGVTRINISLDTLSEDKYRHITRGGDLKKVLKGIEKALKLNFDKIKINVVLIGGFNDDEIESLANLTLKYPIDVRFIELMPMPEIYNFGQKAYIPSRIILEKLKNLQEVSSLTGETARLFKMPKSLGNVGIISPLTDHFCFSCNRIRITADGFVKACLHSGEEFSIKGFSDDEMRRVFEKAIGAKAEKHRPLSFVNKSQSNRSMNQIGG